MLSAFGGKRGGADVGGERLSHSCPLSICFKWAAVHLAPLFFLRHCNNRGLQHLISFLFNKDAAISL